VYARADQPLTSGDPQEQALDDRAQANQGYLAPGYTPLVSTLDDTSGEPFGGKLELRDATPDATAAILESQVAAGGLDSGGIV
jgi:hypothetical protein